MSLDATTVKRRAVSGVVNYSIRTALMYVITLVATGFLGVYLSPAEFGTYYIVTALIGLFTFMSDIGLAATLVQKKEEPTTEELRTTFTVQQILAVCILLLIVGLTPFWQRQSHLDRFGLELLYALGFSFLMASLKTIPTILLERKLEFGKKVIPEMVESIVFYGIVVVLASQHFGIRSFTVAVLARSFIGVFVIYLLQGWPFGLAWSKETFRHLIRFGAKFQLNDLLARIKDDLFTVFLANILTATEIGIIGWAKKWSMFPYQFSVNNVVSVMFPIFSRLQDDREKLARVVEKSIFFISMLIFPILAGMIAMAYPLTEIIPHYQKWQPAIPSLVFFCINIAWAAISTPLTNTLNAIGEISVTLKLMMFWTVATWVLTPLMIHYFTDCKQLNDYVAYYETLFIG
jgi:O-antigen/teichoic acid export membrane protein